jgi:NAD(P)-dependent dehydrogenase (short-subunit alcohol dehydrogenase family)
VINLGSIDGLRTTQVPHYAYSTSKAAVHHLTKVLANELAASQITVNAIAAGPFATKMLAGVMASVGGEEAIAGTVPLGRMGKESDAGGLVLFLASNAGSYVTGAVIPLDGGILIKASL